MSGSKIALRITATDEAAATLAKIGLRLDEVVKRLDGMAAATQKVAETTGLTDVGQAFDKIGGSISHAVDAAAKFIPALTAIAGIATVAGLARTVESFTTFAGSLDLTAQRIGLPVQQLNRLQNATRLAGGSAEDATGLIAGLQNTIAGAVYGRNPEAYGLFHGLGIDIGDIQRGARTAMQTLPELADHVRELYDNDPTHHAAISFLERLGITPNALNLLKDGRAGLASYLSEAEQYGTVTQQQADAARALQVEQQRLGLAFEHLGYDISSAIAPDLIAIIHEITELTHDSTPDIVSGFRAAAGWLHEFLAPENLRAFNHGLQEVAATLHQIWDIYEQSGLSGLFRALVTGGLGAPGGSPSAVDPASVGGPAGAGLEAVWNLLSGLLGGPGTPAHPSAQPSAPAAPASPPGSPSAPYTVLPPGSPTPILRQGSPSDPRGIRDNNPLNLGYRRDQRGVLGSDGAPHNPEGVYPSMDAGVAAAVDNLLHYQHRGITTLSQIINEWAPLRDGNDTPAYIAAVARRTGLNPNVAVNLQDPAVTAGLVAAMARVEEGREIDPAAVTRGVATALGGRPPADTPVAYGQPLAPGASPASGPARVDIRIDHRGVPPGTTLDPIRVDPRVDLSVNQGPSVAGVMPGAR